MLDVFGIKIRPLSFIDKDSVKYTFEQTITFDTTLTIISNINKSFVYEGEFNEYEQAQLHLLDELEQYIKTLK